MLAPQTLPGDFRLGLGLPVRLQGPGEQSWHPEALAQLTPAERAGKAPGLQKNAEERYSSFPGQVSIRVPILTSPKEACLLLGPQFAGSSREVREKTLKIRH